MIPDKYKIKRFEVDELRPEETLADTLSAHSVIETPISRRVFSAFYAFIAIVLFFIVFKSFQLQVIDGNKYATLAEQSSSLKYQLSPLRGIIYDSKDRPMVENIPVFDLVAVRSYLPQNESGINDLFKNLIPIIGQNESELRKLFEENSDQAIFLLKRSISKEETIKIKNLALEGIFAVTNAQRYYTNGLASAHLIGYISQVTPEDLKSDDYYYLNDRIGRLGLEAQYEIYLRGAHRVFDFKKDDIFNEQADISSGQNLFLSIDSSIQERLYKSISSVFATAGVRRGAAIIQNPKTGAVLGLVSMPTFDNNIFENSAKLENINRITKLLNNTDRPLLNRAIAGRYSPGSTIKPLLALAGLKEGTVKPSTIILANGSISIQSEVDPNVYYTFRDWKVHGWTDVKKAIANSVDVYFYALGGGYGNIIGLGIDRIASYLKGASADKITNIDLPGEISGFVPSKKWKKETKNEAWYVGDTYNISIGQGDLGVTPIWINTYIGAIANGGDLIKPFIVKEIKNLSGQSTAQFYGQILGKMPFDQNTFNVVKQGMRQAVLSGTATMLQDIPVPLAAKTGTAQVTGRGLNSLFTVFGPYENPEIVMTILVENINQSQGLAIGIANNFLLWYFNEYKKGDKQ